MSNTRHAKAGSPLRQEKFCSSPDFEKGLLANLVARRCSILESAEERELIWFLQLLSHREGGLEKVAGEMAELFNDRAGTSTMLKFGTKRGQVYNPAQIEKIFRGIPNEERCAFSFYGEDLDLSDLLDGEPTKKSEEKPHAAEEFLNVCQLRLSQLEEDLKVFCLNPTRTLADAAPWYFAALPDCLREYHADWIKAQSSGIVTTELGEKLSGALDYSLESKCLVLIEGQARTGKTFSTKAWCEQRPGRARYVQVPSTNDEVGFFRAIAKALGVSSGLGWKAVQIRERVEEVLQSGDLIVVFDEAHYCWPNHVDPRTLPARINWLMTALVNHAVPVALVTTPQFIKTQKVVEARTHWTSEQFTGRIDHYERLPGALSEADLVKVANAVLPEGDSKSIEILVSYAQASAKYLAGIESVVRRARYLAKQDGRSEPTRSDIKRAIQESVIPSDSALATSLAVAPKTRGKRSAMPLQADFEASADRLQPRASGQEFSDVSSNRGATRKSIDMVPSDRADAPS